MASGTRERIVEATASLFQRRGYTGSGLKAISTDSGAPLGSLYHFFPAGKVELAAETLRWSARGYAELVGSVLDAAGEDVVAAMRIAFVTAAEHLEASDFVDACPIATVALEVASSNETLRVVTAEIFEGWLRGLERRFLAAGIEPGPARELATLFLAALEGGFLLSRAAKDATPMRTLGASVAAAVEAALPAS